LIEEARQFGAGEITSGLACVHHRLAQVTKDCDIWLGLDSLAAFRQTILQRRWMGTTVAYRSPLSIPLDVRWLAGGWSAHLEWTAVPPAQLDIFGVLPRVIWHSNDGLYSDLLTLAQVKMTQRERDWPTVHEVGSRLIAGNKVLGLLFLQTADSLTGALNEFPADDMCRQFRPLLSRIGRTSPVLLSAALRIEQTFWRRIDHLRLACFHTAAEAYYKATRADWKKCQGFAEQDQLLIAKAEELLPSHPLAGKIDDIVMEAMNESLIMVDRSQFDSSWLPLFWARKTLETCLPRKSEIRTKINQ
jgi:hypothetical protein